MTEERKRYIREWKLKNRDKCREASRRYYIKNATKINSVVGVEECGCGRVAIEKHAGSPRCEFCRKIEERYSELVEN